jgi:hypothetical protein
MEIACMFRDWGKAFHCHRLRTHSLNEFYRTSHRRTQQTPMKYIGKTMISNSSLPLADDSPLEIGAYYHVAK